MDSQTDTQKDIYTYGQATFEFLLQQRHGVGICLPACRKLVTAAAGVVERARGGGERGEIASEINRVAGTDQAKALLNIDASGRVKSRFPGFIAHSS